MRVHAYAFACAQDVMNVEAPNPEVMVRVLGAVNTLLAAENYAVYDDPNLPEPRDEVAKSFFFVLNNNTTSGGAGGAEKKEGSSGSKPEIAPAPVQRDPEEMIALMEKGFTFMRIVVKDEVGNNLFLVGMRCMRMQPCFVCVQRAVNASASFL